MSTHTRRSAFTLVEIVIVAALAALIAGLSIGPIRRGIRNSRENTIRENLQSVWIAANRHFLQYEKTEVTLEPPTVANEASALRLPALKKVVGENYATVNNGKITSKDKTLEISYKDKDTTRTVAYPTGQ
ncbi:MAG: hypothetical protein LBV54_00115 [Puniceicoccales bacterium]|nr:hypothetical protein [Puniceicoccales bacterium]